jgi:hypothetical protein
MDQNEYKLKINDPCAFRKNILEETLQILKAHFAPEALVIEKSFEVGGIEKPPNHQHPSGYDYYWVKCTSDEADKIASYLFEAEYTAVPDNGETTPEASRYAHLVDIWSNYRDWIENGGLV